jgi:hypothetical protein
LRYRYLTVFYRFIPTVRPAFFSRLRCVALPLQRSTVHDRF